MITPIPFQTINWSQIEKINYPGVSGTATWQTMTYEGLRIRLVEYSNNYVADHWCVKGHVIYCLEGSFISELKTGEKFILTKGMSYIVSDHASEHRSVSNQGVKLLIIDGDFLVARSPGTRSPIL